MIQMEILFDLDFFEILDLIIDYKITIQINQYSMAEIIFKHLFQPARAIPHSDFPMFDLILGYICSIRTRNIFSVAFDKYREHTKLRKAFF